MQAAQSAARSHTTLSTSQYNMYNMLSLSLKPPSPAVLLVLLELHVMVIVFLDTTVCVSLRCQGLLRCSQPHAVRVLSALIKYISLGRRCQHYQPKSRLVVTGLLYLSRDQAAQPPGSNINLPLPLPTHCTSPRHTAPRVA